MFDNLPTNNNSQSAAPIPGGSTLPKPQNPVAAPKPPTPAVPVAPQGQSFSPPPAKPIEDMFSDRDAQEKPAIFQAKTPPPPLNPAEGMVQAQIDPYTGEQIKAKNKTIVFALMLISLMLVAMLGWYAYRAFFRPMVPDLVPPVDQPSANIIIDPIVPIQNEPADLPANDFNNLGSGQVKDSDGDGLSDDDELRIYHTDPNNEDSDGDGLFDREEVKVYNTDPLDTDSDKDGYADGMEVSGGYNPNGEGSLYDSSN